MSEPLRERAEALLAVVAEHEQTCLESPYPRSVFETAAREWWPRYIAAAREELAEALSNLSAFEVGMASRVVDRHLESAAEAIVSRWEKALGVR